MEWRDGMEKTGSDRAKYLIGFVILAAVVLVGISAFFGANSAKGTLGKMDNALEGVKAGNAPANTPTLDGSAAALPSQPAAPAQANGSVATGSGGEAQVPIAAQQPAVPAPANITPSIAAGQQNATAAKKEVVIDFLYADWCGHCQSMKPIIARLDEALPDDRFEVRYWNEASRSDPTAAAIYSAYTSAGYFQGFPTFVANGNSPKVGSMPEATFKAWVCSKFSPPKPTGC